MALTELYKFAQNGTVYPYTSANESITYDGNVYESETIGRNETTQTNELNKNHLSITLPRENAFALAMLHDKQDYSASMDLMVIDDGTPAVVWKGRVVASSASGSEITLECEQVYTSQRRSGFYSRSGKRCRHALYHRGCTVNAASHATAGTCTAASGRDITVTEAGLKADGTMTGGMIKASDGIYRYVLSHSGTTLTLQYPVQTILDELDASGTAAIHFYPGCDKSYNICNSRFGNTINFGGDPWITQVNPFNLTSVV